MIFRPELVKLIQAGRKTQTRRPAKDDEPCRYLPGRVYAVQPGRGRPGVGHITIHDVRAEELGAIVLKDAWREGFKTTGEFREYWEAMHGTFDETMLVWVISFVKGDVLDRPRLLAARSGGPGGDYTTVPARAMRGEGEAVPASVQDRYAREALLKPVAEWEHQRQRLLAVISEIRGHAANPLAEQNLRGLERQVAALDRKMRAAA